MTYYKWTEEQLRQLGPGCTVERVWNDKRTKLTVFRVYRDSDSEDLKPWMTNEEIDEICEFDDDFFDDSSPTSCWYVRSYENIKKSLNGTTYTGVNLYQCDPSTLKPPAPAWLQKLAKRKLGKDVSLKSGAVTQIYNKATDVIFHFSTYQGVHHRTLCARFLDTLPEVEA